MNGLIDYIKHFDYDTNVFQYPVLKQAELYTKVLTDAFAKFVTCRKVPIRQNDQPWSNSCTRLLLRKKNRNYQFYKKINNKYTNLSHQENISQEIITKYYYKKNKAFEKAREAANESTKANRRVKFAFYNSVNSTLNNSLVPPKKKFQILLKLMKNNKYTATPPLVENIQTVNDPQQKLKFLTLFLHQNQVSKIL